jgi:uncharacterized membrane protein YiaA
MNTQTDINSNNSIQPSRAFIIGTWAALAIGIAGYLIGLFNADIALNEKGYYLIALLFGLYGSVSLQKTVRDKAEGIPVSKIYMMITWGACASVIVLITLGLYNADFLLSEKGFYGISFILSLFAAVSAQKNIRDMADANA